MTKPLRHGKKRRKAIARQQKKKKVFSTVQLETLPNEVIIHVFRFLEIVDLLKCEQVSKRFKDLSNNEYLWPKKFNLCFKKVPSRFLQKLLENGCKYLSLSCTILEGTLNLPKVSRLKYLNLYAFEMKSNRENSEKILEASSFLEKLSLSETHISSKLISIFSLQNGKTLKVLDLSQSTFCRNENNCINTSLGRMDNSSCISDLPIKQIVENCTELKELNLSSTWLCETSVDILVSNLTSKIEKLDLFDIHCLRDQHIKTLVIRCNNITELNFGGRTLITRQSLDFVIEHLKSTLVKLNLLFCNVELASSDIFKLKSMEKLKLICCFSYSSVSQWLKEMLPNIQIDFDGVNMKIATPDCLRGRVRGDNYGFWEINAQAEELFDDYNHNLYEDISE
jgi:F-box and leucine-rich repeat protein 1 (S-phase kinase-associated protein 2)